MNPLFTRFVLLTVFILPAAAQNQDLPYDSGSTGADGPFIVPSASNALSAFGIAYDSEREEIVRFGGETIAGVQSSQTWIHRSDGWQVAEVPVSPPARAFGAMAFDEVRNEVVLFGGLSGGVRLNDTWVWNGTSWNQKSPSVSPPERSHTAMAWDAVRGQLVLFGGRGASGALQDTWVWNGSNWSQKTPATSPPARVNHAMASYPPLSGVAVACGNGVDALNADSARGDLWIWNGTDWTSSGTVFPVREAASLVFDPVAAKLLLWGGAVRSGVTTTTAASALISWNHGAGAVTLPGLASRYQHGAIWHGNLNGMVLNSGRTTTADLADSWVWSNKDWLGLTFPNYTFDMTSKPDAIWHFTSIAVPVGATITFRRNAANSPVLWLASENVTINGIINLSGSVGSDGGGYFPRGGPGGFDGGGAFPTLTSGKGPGGGRGAGIGGLNGIHGEGAKHSTIYGTLFAQPLIGGSGGGGGRGHEYLSGMGGGGGGAIVIASSKDINLTGSILARGGSGYLPPRGVGASIIAGAGGSGSGGTIRLVADRILAVTGTISTSGAGAPYTEYPIGASEGGRVRLEALVRQTTPSLLGGVVSQSVPVAGSILTQAGGRLWFTKVDGENVANPPAGDPVNPDVVFTASGDVQVEVESLNIPDGTLVTVTINHSLAGTINLTGVPLQQGKAILSGTIPGGQGVMQAFATYNVGGPPPAP